MSSYVVRGRDGSEHILGDDEIQQAMSRSAVGAVAAPGSAAVSPIQSVVSSAMNVLFVINQQIAQTIQTLSRLGTPSSASQGKQYEQATQTQLLLLQQIADSATQQFETDAANVGVATAKSRVRR